MISDQLNLQAVKRFERKGAGVGRVGKGKLKTEKCSEGCRIERQGKRLGHIANRQSKYLSRRNVGVRPLRARVRLFGKAYGGPSKWPLRADGWSVDGL